jgi:hypothetical protein
MWSKAVGSLSARSSCRRRPISRCNSRSPSKREPRTWPEHRRQHS